MRTTDVFPGNSRLARPGMTVIGQDVARRAPGPYMTQWLRH